MNKLYALSLCTLFIACQTHALDPEDLLKRAQRAVEDLSTSTERIMNDTQKNAIRLMEDAQDIWKNFEAPKTPEEALERAKKEAQKLMKALEQPKKAPALTESTRELETFALGITAGGAGTIAAGSGIYGLGRLTRSPRLATFGRHGAITGVLLTACGWASWSLVRGAK